MTTILAERLAMFPEITLAHGSHSSFNDGACAMELASWLTGDDWSDHPPCVCPVLGEFMRTWNDGISDDAERTTLLKPLIPKLINTRGDNKLEQRRAMMAADWMIRVHTPAWLRLAKLDEPADALASLPEITDFAQCHALMPTLEAVRSVADAAWVAAWDAAGDAAGGAAGRAARDVARAAARDVARAAARAAARDVARAAAGDAAWDAAWAAAGDAAWDAAWAAARDVARAAAGDAAGGAAGRAARDVARAVAWGAAGDAAGDAAWDAAWGALAETKSELQQSALALVERMIARAPQDNEAAE